MFTKFLSFWRYIRFQFIYKRRFLKTPGIPCLCNNLKHPYHESKFEMDTCNLLCDFFGQNDVLVPHQHKHTIKFDFIIKETAIFEPHGMWTNKLGENTYFDYYKQRRSYADKIEELINLPLVVLSNSSDLSYLKKRLNDSKNYKITCQDVAANLLEKYRTSELPKQQEFIVRTSNIWLLLLLLISLFFNILLLIVK